MRILRAAMDGLRRLLRRIFTRRVEREAGLSCDMCEASASVKITYGLYEMYKAGRPYHKLSLCGVHASELWGRCSGSVTANLMYWRNEDVEAE